MVDAAKDLKSAMRVLDPRPLEFDHDGHPTAPSANSAFYEPPPVEGEAPNGRLKKPTPIERIKRQLMEGGSDTRCFLSGHVGSGKSTELNRLSVDREVLARFAVVRLRLEEQEWAVLDAAQLFFRIADALHQYGEREGLLADSKAWVKFLEVINRRVYGETSSTGLKVDESIVAFEAGPAFAKLKAQLKLSPVTRQVFRKLGETDQSVLRDLIAGLAVDMELALSKDDARHDQRLLLIVDDLDKVRGEESQRDIFDTNLNTLLTLPFCAVYTLPSGVAFGGNRGDLRQSYEHLHPVRVLRKCPDGYEPLDAVIEDRLPYFVELVHRRVAPPLIDDGAIKRAAAYSGGVLRTFFYLLREGCNLADYNGFTSVDATVMDEVVRDARRKESAGVHSNVREVLRHVHRTNLLRSEEDRRYLDQSRVLECYNGGPWS